MKLPKTERAAEYVGLYVIDFSPCQQGPDQCGLGYTASEVAVLLESERFAAAKVYKIHRADPDGTMELQGVSSECFGAESGMFFHCRDDRTGRDDFATLLSWAHEHTPPCRAQLQLARRQDTALLIALIYPAEYEQEMGNWLSDSGFRGNGAVDAGISQVRSYYSQHLEIVEQEQLWPAASLRNRDRQALLAAVGQPLQR